MPCWVLCPCRCAVCMVIWPWLGSLSLGRSYWQWSAHARSSSIVTYYVAIELVTLQSSLPVSYITVTLRENPWYMEELDTWKKTPTRERRTSCQECCIPQPKLSTAVCHASKWWPSSPSQNATVDNSHCKDAGPHNRIVDRDKYLFWACSQLTTMSC